MKSETQFIDMTPTWGEMGNIIWRLAESNEQMGLAHARSEFAKAMAAAEALRSIQDTLTEEQKHVVGKVLNEELAKQGY